MLRISRVSRIIVVLAATVFFFSLSVDEAAVPNLRVCPDGVCVPGEDPCICPQDCGPVFPEGDPGFGGCSDGIDNDCDGLIDCASPNCASDPACLCGNGLCEPVEECTCPADCVPPPSGACPCTSDADCNDGISCTRDICDPTGFCLFDPDDVLCDDGNGCTSDQCDPLADCQNTPIAGCVPCVSDAECDDGLACTSDACSPLTGTCSNDPIPGCVDCGNLLCEPGEDCNLCPLDCPPGSENPLQGNCTDGVDNDCDGVTDCAGPICAADPACAGPGGCGNLICEPGENPCNCAVDCGAQTPVEMDCADGIDNDCDGLADCGDPDCQADPVCGGPGACGDLLCEPGEECTCPADCGPPPPGACPCASDADCNDGIACTIDSCGSPVDPGSCFFDPDDGLCDDGNGCTSDQCDPLADCLNTPIAGCVPCVSDAECDDGLLCTLDACNPATGTCSNNPIPGCVGCGNLVCDPGEDCNLCPLDCPPGSENPLQGNCTDGVDNDCDGVTDCAGPICAADPACAGPGGCGDLICEPGENPCNCAVDCGAQTPVEIDCADGIDNDCDGLADCGDPDCQADPVCGGPGACGDLLCEPGEECTCPADCGPPPPGACPCASDADCNDGIACTIDSCGSPVDPGSCFFDPDDGLCDDGNGCTSDQCDPLADCLNSPIAGCVPCVSDAECDDGLLCTLDACNPATGTCSNNPIPGCVGCGNLICDPGEDCNTCLIDCPPVPEDPVQGNCTDGVDNNCDGLIDCASPICLLLDPGCLCGNGFCEPGEECTCAADCGPPPPGLCPCNSDADCSDGIACTRDVCEPFGLCLNDPDDGLCDDGNGCTSDFCDPLADCLNPPIPGCVPCVSNADCDDGLVCTLDACDPSTGTCSNNPIPGCVGCGNLICELGEDPCSCPLDCGAQAPIEADCADGIDNDCDGFVDCGDADCAGDPTCCGDGICDAVENQCTCAADCGTPPLSEIGCADGIDNDCDGLIDCGDADCAGDPTCCGDGICEAFENQCTCAADCGTPPLSETICGDGKDNDCDGLIDCGDADCAGDPDCCGDGNCDAVENQCTCAADCGTPPLSETGCADGIDNDCDGLIDCGDADCAGDPDCCGDGICDAVENQCTCAADCGTPPLSETSCGDGNDNDCDGLIDCGDADCAGNPACCGNGICDAVENQCTCAADCGTPPPNETSCTDANDNDCDGMIDCGDVDCAGDAACITCGNGNCQAGEDSCNCPADCGTPPLSEASCTDAIDNDCDGLIDCGDADCAGDPVCCGDGICDSVENQCTCAADCGTPPLNETDCNDGTDNDCDGLIDCDDAVDCASDPACCGDGNCDASENPCTCEDDCGPPPPDETNCTDGVDNDCDGLIDCDDDIDCAGQPACCGDGICDAVENACTCEDDCGPPPPDETSCDDGVDNDCDGDADCNDSDCFGDPACAACPNLICEPPAEDQSNCPEDCTPSDVCADAPTLPEGTYAFSTVGATTDGFNPVETELFPEFDLADLSPDLWVHFVVPADGLLRADMCATGLAFDSMIALYLDASNPTVCPCPIDQATHDASFIQARDENCTLCADAGAGFVEINALAGECYTIRLGGFDGDTGPGTLDIQMRPARLCGNGTCDAPDEDQCNCPSDCGPPPSPETDCTDGLDNDCNGVADDCDPNCFVDFEFRAVIVDPSSPSPADETDTLAESLPSVLIGDSFLVEFWATDSGLTNTGIVSAYADLAYPGGCVTVGTITPSALFNQFTSGSDDIQGAFIDELGGSQLAAGVGVEPSWARIASAEFTALASCDAAEFRLFPGETESSAFGRGIVNRFVSRTTTLDIEGCCCIYNLDDGNVCLGGANNGLICSEDADCDGGGTCNLGNCDVDGGDLALFAPCWLCSDAQPCWAANTCATKDFDCNGLVAGGDLGWFAGAFNRNCSELDALAEYPPCRQCDGPIICPWPNPECPDPQVVVARAGATEPTGESEPLVEMALRLRTDQVATVRLSEPALSGIRKGDRLFAEVWVRDRTPSSQGLTAVFADVLYQPARFKAVATTPSRVFALFAEASLQQEPGLTRVGGATLEPDWAVETWVRVSVVELEALVDMEKPGITIRPSEPEAVSGFGRGLIPNDRIKVIDGPPIGKSLREAPARSR